MEKILKPGAIVEFPNGLKISINPVNGVQYILAPGGKITGIRTPDDFIVPLTLETDNGRRRLELKKTKAKANPSVEWNQFRVTFLSIQVEGAGYGVKLKTESIPLKRLALGEISNTMVSGDEVQGPDNIVIRHSGYLQAHTMNTQGQSGTESRCLITLVDGSETKELSIPAPLDQPLTLTWKKWELTFTKTDPDAGTMPTQKPIEFKITKK